MREKDSVFRSACHNSFAGLPLNWSLRGMLMLRESGRFRLPTPPCRRTVSLLARRRTPLSMPKRNICLSVRLEVTANQIGSNSVTSRSHFQNRYADDVERRKEAGGTLTGMRPGFSSNPQMIEILICPQAIQRKPGFW